MIKCVLFNYACMYVHRGLVKWYNNGLQNHCWEFDSLRSCHLDCTLVRDLKYYAICVVLL